mmetsp:Transcript_17611/g.14986  ORF Transcript_17611/g.14986 Transcript_17611/m.14986 type:complete len:127 (-) Transcript_17611:131-511(-)
MQSPQYTTRRRACGYFISCNTVVLAHVPAKASVILEHAFNVKEGQFVKSCAIRSTLVAFTVIVAIFVPNFQGLIGLLGSVCFSLIHNFYPSIFYIRLFIWEKVRSGSKYHIMQFKKRVSPTNITRQ